MAVATAMECFRCRSVLEPAGTNWRCPACTALVVGGTPVMDDDPIGPVPDALMEWARLLAEAACAPRAPQFVMPLAPPALEEEPPPDVGAMLIRSRLDFRETNPPADPVVKGSDLTAAEVAEFLDGGWTVDDALNHYPGLERDDVAACLEWARRQVAVDG